MSEDELRQENERLKKENENLRKKLRALRKQLENYTKRAARDYRDQQDYLPYPEEDRE